MYCWSVSTHSVSEHWLLSFLPFYVHSNGASKDICRFVAAVVSFPVIVCTYCSLYCISIYLCTFYITFVNTPYLLTQGTYETRGKLTNERKLEGFLSPFLFSPSSFPVKKKFHHHFCTLVMHMRLSFIFLGGKRGKKSKLCFTQHKYIYI